VAASAIIRSVKTISLHNQSTSQTPSDSEPTQTLPDPSLTQRIAWTPLSTPPRLTVTPGGGPQPDIRARRDLLRGIAALLLTLFVFWRLPLSHSHAKLSAVAPHIASPLAQRPAPVFERLPAPLYRSRIGSDAQVRVYLVAPSVPLPPEE